MGNTFLSLQEFKSLTGINVEDDIINVALTKATEYIKNKIFIFKKIEYQTSTDDAKLNTPIADNNADGVISSDDLSVFELNTDTYVETDRSAYIDSFQDKYGYLTFTSSLPINSDSILVIEYYTTKYTNDKIKEQLKDLNKYLAVNYVFDTVPFSRLQEGITSWNLNGVSVTFDEGVMRNIIDANTKTINKMIRDLQPFYITETRLGFDLSNGSTGKYLTSNIFRR